MKDRFIWLAVGVGLFGGYLIGVTQPCVIWPASNFCGCQKKCACDKCACDPCECPHDKET